MHAPGGLAEYMLCRAATLVPVPDHLAPDVAVFAEPVAVAVRALSKADELRGATVVVVGAGVVGSLLVQVARAEFGTLSNHSVFLEVPSTAGMPDGLTVDDDGCVWVALWGGGAIHRYTPRGELDRRIELPVSQVTSMCFMGPDLRTLAITSARHGLDEAALEREPLAGSVFSVDAGGSGAAANPWRPLKG
ncbi:SMP-30/gluconolactonase/LRE family protein [Microbacterium sp. DT81.1]|uniref:SMP-30/gluconolactonase/LRE family protein n=1 Tax=Microbacterium sp. DT81.1 TaxID=3393413 RepID=UPI003CF8F0A3